MSPPSMTPRESFDRIRVLPIWGGAIEIEPLKGGISNESWLVRDGGRRLVVRFGTDYPFHHVSRAYELMVARAASEAGFSPEIVFAEPGVMVSSWIDARTLAAEDVRADAARIASLMREFHARMPALVSGPASLFWPFHVVRDYARTLEAGRSRMSAELPRYLRLADQLEAAQAPLPIVFGHNDLLPANFLDDGERLWLIDFEYAGFSTAMFDLAGIASNAGFDAEQSQDLLARYFGRFPAPEILRSHGAMQCASLLREAMWSMVSELHLSAPGVDYVAYTADNLARLEAALGRYRAVHGRIDA